MSGFRCQRFKCQPTLFLQVGTRHAVSETSTMPYFTLADTACRVPTSYHLYSVICYLSSIFRPLSPPESGGVPRSGEGVCIFRFPLSVFRFTFISYPLPLRVCPRVALGSAPLRGHRMTFSHSSKDPLRPLSQGEKVSGHLKPEPAPPLTPSAICYLPSVIRTLSSVLCTPDNSLLLSLRTEASHRG